MVIELSKLAKDEQDDWQHVVALIEHAFASDVSEPLLELLLTPDERETLVTRLIIIKELLEGKRSQRELKATLGVGIATITRGSNSLKLTSTEFKTWLRKQLNIETGVQKITIIPPHFLYSIVFSTKF